MNKLLSKETKPLIDSLDANIPFVSELLQADIRLFVKSGEEVYTYNYYHPSQDSLFLGAEKGKELAQHKDIYVHKAFESGNPILGQYGLVINNRPIQEFAYPLSSGAENFAVLAVERDIYLTRSILGQHWDLIAETLMKTLKEKMLTKDRFPVISPGEGALIVKNNSKGPVVFFANPLAASLLSEIAENSSQLINRPLDDMFSGLKRKEKGKDSSMSIDLIEEISLRQRTVRLRYVKLDDELSVILIKDVSELKVRETLLREIHHRVKNNLQTVISLLRMQKRRNSELNEAFKEAISRIKSITLVHEYLSHSGDLELIDLGQLVGNIIKESLASFGGSDIKLDYHCPEKVFVTSEKATNLALVINELLMNSLEHAGKKLSKIDIQLSLENELLNVEIADNGLGFPKDFDYQSSTGLGWEIIRALAEDSLSAKILIENSNGAKVKIEVPHS